MATHDQAIDGAQDTRRHDVQRQTTGRRVQEEREHQCHDAHDFLLLSGLFVRRWRRHQFLLEEPEHTHDQWQDIERRIVELDQKGDIGWLVMEHDKPVRHGQVAEKLPFAEQLENAIEAGLLSQFNREIQHRVQRDPDGHLQEHWCTTKHVRGVDTLFAIQLHHFRVQHLLIVGILLLELFHLGLKLGHLFAQTRHVDL